LIDELTGRLHHRDRHAQHAAGGARVRFTAFMYLGEADRIRSTSKMFTAPHDQRTQDYITGRFG